MRNFIFGTIFGIIVATVGFSGVARIVDNGIEKTKELATESAK